MGEAIQEIDVGDNFLEHTESSGNNIKNREMGLYPTQTLLYSKANN